MKWLYKPTARPEDEARRTKSGFLWFPKYTIYIDPDAIGHKYIYDWRWLERAIWEDKYDSLDESWTAVKWINGPGVKV